MAKLHNPATMQWELTTECNHDCVHCYNYWRKDFEKIADLSRSKTEQEYLEIAKRIVKIKPVAVTLTGGEPLLVFNEIKSSLEYLQKNNIFVTINTNATLLTDEMCKYLKNRRVHLFVSFPCAEPEVCDIITNRSGSFSRITKSLDLAYSFGVDFVCNVVVSKQNIDYVEKTVDFLVENYRLDYISLTRVAKPINSDDSFNSWLLNHDDINRLLDISVKKTKEYKGLTIGTACPYTPCSINSQDAFDLFGYQKLCTAGKTSFAIDIDGNFKACPRDSRHYGNILHDDFAAIYENMDEWRNGSFVPDQCKGCKEFLHCLGGCRVDSIPFTGKSNALDSISNPNNLPLKFHPKKSIKNYDGKVFVFDKDDVICVKCEDCVRLSHERHFLFVTTKLYDFLSFNRSGFTNKDLATAFKQEESDLINNVIGRLLSERIIKPKNN